MSAGEFMGALLDGLPTGHRAVVWVLPDRWTVAYPADAAKAAQAVEKVHAKGREVYVGAGFVTAATAREKGKKGRQSNATVAGLFGLFLDLDVKGSPDRKGGRKKTGAPSKQAALDLAARIAAPTLTVDTGGGVQAWYLFDQPWVFADEDERAQAADLAHLFQQAHREQVQWKIDATADLARVGRVPGTLNRKAEPVPVQLLHAGGPRYAVADLRAMVPAGLSMPRKAASASLNGHAEVSDDRLASLRAVAGVARVYAGGTEPFAGDASDRDYALSKELVKAGATDSEGDALIAEVRAAEGDPKGERADYPARTMEKARVEVTEQSVRQSGTRRVHLPKSSSIRPERVAHAWHPYLPLRSVSLLAGRGGMGKSTLHAHIAAGLSRGELEGDLRNEPVGVVIATAEDSLSATVVPRLMAAGADMDRVRLLRLEEGGIPGLLDVAGDLELLRQAVAEVGARVLLLDPIVAFLDRVDSHNDQQVRRALGPLAQWADDDGLAINGLIHINKRESHDALARVSGSGAFGNLARSVLMLGHLPHDDEPDEEGNEAVHLVHLKYNLGKKGPSWRCRLEDAPVRDEGVEYPASRIVMEAESDARADDLVSPPATSDERGAKREAHDYLLVALEDGPRAASELREKAMRDLGVSETTVNRAKRLAGIQSIHRKVSKGEEPGIDWALPASHKPKGEGR